MGVSVGCLVIVTNSYTLLRALGVPLDTQVTVMSALLAISITAITFVTIEHRREIPAQPITDDVEVTARVG